MAEDADPESPSGKARAARGMPQSAEFDGISLLFYTDLASRDRAGKDQSEERKAVSRQVAENNANFIDYISVAVQARFECGPLVQVHPKDLPARVK